MSSSKSAARAARSLSRSGVQPLASHPAIPVPWSAWNPPQTDHFLAHEPRPLGRRLRGGGVGWRMWGPSRYAAGVMPPPNRRPRAPRRPPPRSRASAGPCTQLRGHRPAGALPPGPASGAALVGLGVRGDGGLVSLRVRPHHGGDAPASGAALRPGAPGQAGAAG